MNSSPVASTSGRHGRRVVFHADDFGLNPAVNRGILAGFSYGLLTSTSVLVNAPAFSEALRGWNTLARERELGRLPSQAFRSRLGDPPLPFDLGIHLNLTQGKPLTGRRFPRQLLDSRGRFPGAFRLLSRLLSFGSVFRNAIREELAAQIERLLDHGIVPTHLNGHQYVEMMPVVSGIIPELVSRYRIGIVRLAWERNLTRTCLLHRFRPVAWGLAQVKRLFAFHHLLRLRRSSAVCPDAFLGTAHAGLIDLPLLQRFIDASEEGTTEIAMHPGIVSRPEHAWGLADGWADPLAKLRPRELKCLTSRGLANLLSNQHVDLGRLSRLVPAIPGRAAA